MLSTTKCLPLALVLGTLLIVSCSNPNDQEVFNSQVRVRIDQEPDRLNPILSTYASSPQIERWIFNALQEYDPVSMEMSPVLLEASPTMTKVQAEDGTSVMQTDFRIRDDALWDNGEPVTGYDYLFTMKACLVPGIENSSWGKLHFRTLKY